MNRLNKSIVHYAGEIINHLNNITEFFTSNNIDDNEASIVQHDLFLYEYYIGKIKEDVFSKVKI